MLYSLLYPQPLEYKITGLKWNTFWTRTTKTPLEPAAHTPGWEVFTASLGEEQMELQCPFLTT
ncbi:Cop9 Signalosome Complex Subunit 5 [Manis pentadactyla]|nr:Cop9 Signalosome Complex Subunit 5 [Manis pentadactyla]